MTSRISNRKVSLIIVNFESETFVENCISSITTFQIPIETIIIVDNSFNGPGNFNLNNNFIKTNILCFNQNLGFAMANNLAASKTDTKYICFLNPDTLFIEDCISPIIEYMEKNPDCGACAPMLCYEDLRYQNSTGPKMGFWYEFMEAFMLIGIARKLRKMKLFRSTNSKPVFVDWVSGAFMIVKKVAFDEVNGFSEDYFLNYEDIDFCRKLQNRGYENFYFPGYKCIHFDHGSFRNNYETLVFSRYQSRLIYGRLHYNSSTAFVVRTFHILGIIMRILGTAIVYNGNEKTGRLKGYMKSLKLYLLKKR